MGIKSKVLEDCATGTHTDPVTMTSAVPRKTLYVGNLGAQTKTDSLKEFLGLTDTDTLELKINNKNNYYAFVTVPEP